MSMNDTYEEESGDESIKPTEFDLLKLDSMAVGDKIDSESMAWRVFRYKDHYVLFLLNSNNKKEFENFKTLEELVEYLNS